MDVVIINIWEWKPFCIKFWHMILNDSQKLETTTITALKLGAACDHEY